MFVKSLKGIVHRKLIHSPSCCPKPAWVYFFCWTQNKNLKHVGNQMFTNVLHIIFLCSFIRRKRLKFTQVWDNIRVREGWQNLFLGGLYLWKQSCKTYIIDIRNLVHILFILFLLLKCLPPLERWMFILNG